MDTVSFIMQAETDGFETEEEYIEGLQQLIDSGVIFSLQGSWQREAVRCCEDGLCHGLALRGMTLVDERV